MNDNAPTNYVPRELKSTMPFRFNVHSGDIGHSLIFGPTNAGKSVLTGDLILALCREQNVSPAKE